MEKINMIFNWCLLIYMKYDESRWKYKKQQQQKTIKKIQCLCSRPILIQLNTLFAFLNSL